MLRYMLDTNTCIYVIRMTPTRLWQRFNRFAAQVCVSSITLGELYYGAAKSERPFENQQAIEDFAALLRVLPFSGDAASHYGQLRAELERSGRPAGVHDMLIGGHAVAEGLIVVTNNMREFGRMPGVRAENWV